ncbi:uncharacterized protein [Ptychodera flava]|uniref:uncharacterized protein isoform X2 n=1 Tax=Ptychodera flava TaxID=63121 RepID=UPI00396A1FEF
MVEYVMTRNIIKMEKTVTGVLTVMIGPMAGNLIVVEGPMAGNLIVVEGPMVGNLTVVEGLMVVVMVTGMVTKMGLTMENMTMAQNHLSGDFLLGVQVRLIQSSWNHEQKLRHHRLNPHRNRLNLQQLITVLPIGFVPFAACEYPVPISNVAEGRPTFQSSDKPKKDGGSEKAVDGNKDSDLKGGNSCTWTDDEFEPYWQVDLESSYDIYEVVITNRMDCCSGRIKNAQIRVGDSSNFEENPICGRMIIGKMSRDETITTRCGCETPMRGRYVSVQLIDKEQMLHLCEVEVMAG